MQRGHDWAGIDGNRIDEAAYAAEVKAGRVAFAIRKLAQAPYGMDRGAAADWAMLKRVGVQRFLYVFPDYRSNAAPPREQALGFRQAADTIGGLEAGDGAMCMDVEFPGGHLPQPPAAIAAFLDAFVDAMLDVFGHYPIPYSSRRVEDGSDTDALHGILQKSPLVCPLWAKVSYRLAARQPPDPIDPPMPPAAPVAWTKPNSPGTWLVQKQGDAIHVPGFSSTVDLDVFRTLSRANAAPSDAGRINWVRRQFALGDGPWDTAFDDEIGARQTAWGLDADRIIGVRTFARISRLPPAAPAASR